MVKKILVCIFVLIITSTSASALNYNSVSAECAVVISAQTCEVLYAKNENKKHSMASTTKIMTALLAVESGLLQHEIKVSEDMLKVEGTSMGLLPGDSVSLNELVYGMLLPSGNDAANVTAIFLGSDTTSFAAMMNSRAKEIGMMNTNFVTPSGLDNENHYSTAFDMALLGREAVKNPQFLNVCSSKKATLTYGNPPYSRTLYNHNRLLDYYDDVFGIKTGFTKKSGRCLVSYAEKNGVGLIAVTLNDKNDWYDHKLMLDYGFKTVSVMPIDFKLPQTLTVVGGIKNNIKIKSESFNVYTSSNANITTKTYIGRFLYAPIENGSIVGYSDIFVNGEKVGTASITAVEQVQLKQIAKPKTQTSKKSFFKKLKERLFND